MLAPACSATTVEASAGLNDETLERSNRYVIAVTGPDRCTLFTTSEIVPDTLAPDPGDASTGACRTTSGPTLKLRAAEKRPTVPLLVARARQKYVFAPASFGSAMLVVRAGALRDAFLVDDEGCRRPRRRTPGTCRSAWRRS